MDPLDHLRDTLARQRAHLEQHGVLYDAPAVEPDELAWAIEEIERLRQQLTTAAKNAAWRESPTAPCGCSWDGWHCPHCGSVTAHSGDAWEPAHTLRCHRQAGGRERSEPDNHEAGEPDKLEGIDESVDAGTEPLEKVHLPADLAADGIRVVVALDAEGNIRHYTADELVKEAEERPDVTQRE